MGQYNSDQLDGLPLNSFPTTSSSSTSTSNSPYSAKARVIAKRLLSLIEKLDASSSFHPLTDHLLNVDTSSPTPPCSPPPVGNISPSHVPQSVNNANPNDAHPTPAPSSLAASTLSNADYTTAASCSSKGCSNLRNANTPESKLTQKKSSICELCKQIPNKRLRSKVFQLVRIKRCFDRYMHLRKLEMKRKGIKEMDGFICCLQFMIQNRKLFSFMWDLTVVDCKDMRSALNAAPFKAGINPGIIKHISSRVSKMSELDKHCVLLFGKISVRPRFAPNSSSRYTGGLDDHGERSRSTVVPREAFVFMISGLRRKWKQPVAFFFRKKPTPGMILAHWIFEVLYALQNTGVKIVATVCDIGSSNIRALRILGYSPERPFFLFGGRKIYTLHNSPDLLKSTRNMFLKYPVRCRGEIEGEVVPDLGRWSHLKALNDLYVKELRTQSSILDRGLCDLTEAYLNPSKQQRKELMFAEEVFSLKVMASLYLCRFKGIAPLETQVTLSFITLISDLFQSLNLRRYRIRRLSPEGLVSNWRSAVLDYRPLPISYRCGNSHASRKAYRYELPMEGSVVAERHDSLKELMTCPSTNQ